jgi:hypothetical protein
VKARVAATKSNLDLKARGCTLRLYSSPGQRLVIVCADLEQGMDYICSTVVQRLYKLDGIGARSFCKDIIMNAHYVYLFFIKKKEPLT